MPRISRREVIANDAWSLIDVQSTGTRRSAAAGDPLVERLVASGNLKVAHIFKASAAGRRSAEALPPLDVSVPAEPGAAYVLAIRHPSGAITFHPPETKATRRRARARGPTGRSVRFRVDFPVDRDEAVAGARRGILSSAVKGVVLKVTGTIADRVLPRLARTWEASRWKAKGLKEGCVLVTAGGLRAGTLASPDGVTAPSREQRSLLLVHGTFSNTLGGFQELANTRGSDGRDFFSAMQPIYGNRIFGFNHFTVSKTPAENARDLAKALPTDGTFDVITHSRGGLVLRTLLEQANDLGSKAKGFRLGRAVLVASPNQGTPLATADRWDKYVGWAANLAELFPENPFTTTVEFISEALTWLAHRLTGALPGVESMDMAGGTVRDLQAVPGVLVESYSALVSNFEATQNVLLRMADVGIDGFFATANDLVVPSEGGWRVSASVDLIDGGRIGCFGPGGNLAQSSGHSVYHNNFFAQAETIDFLVQTLTGRPHLIQALDPSIGLPFRHRRAALAAAPAPAPTAQARAPGRPATAEAAAIGASVARRPAVSTAAIEADDVLHIFLISADDHVPRALIKKMKVRTALLVATYRNARVVETIYTRGGRAAPRSSSHPGGPLYRRPATGHEEGEIRWSRIITDSDAIRSYIDGKPEAPELPDRDKLQAFGVDLFRAIFWGNVRRLYDVARAEAGQSGRRLDVVVTSMISWIADKPWEFAYDPNRQSFLATEDVNFTRNVLTAVPSDELAIRTSPMRILIVAAQPVGMAQLSAAEEEQVIRRGFQDLEQAGLAHVEVLLSATPELLHQRLQQSDRDRFDIVHFIGHGEYRKEEKTGYLIFEDGRGNCHTVNAESMRQILCHRGIRLLFLNACETGMSGRITGRFDFNRGMAPNLVAGGIPVVVANQYKVLDSSATEFAQRFYWSLAQGATIGDAAREARVAVNYSIAGECIDFAVPVVFARNPSHRLFEPTTGRVTPYARRTAAAVRRAASAGVVRVGLWDVNHILPQLEELAARFNELQRHYRFEVVEISAPIGTWRLVPRQGMKGTQEAGNGGSRESQGIIRGREVAKKLRGQVIGLGLNRLFCITAFALGGDVGNKYYENLSLWNDDDAADNRVAIISAAGILDALDEQHYPKERFIANAVASALNDPSREHTRPPQNCPNFFRKHHSSLKARLDYVAGKQRFCMLCRAKIDRDVLEALETVLAGV